MLMALSLLETSDEKLKCSRMSNRKYWTRQMHKEKQISIAWKRKKKINYDWKWKINFRTYLSIQMEICWGVIVVHVIFGGSKSTLFCKGSSIVTESWLLPLDIPPLEKFIGLKSSTLSVVMIGIEPELWKDLRNWSFTKKSLIQAFKSFHTELSRH